MLSRAVSILSAAFRHANARGVIVNEHVLTAEETRLHVEALGRQFEFIHPDNLPARLERSFARPFCLLTFDDGKKSNVTQSAPELYRMGVPAAFFLTTDFLDTGDPLWFDRYDSLIKILGHVPHGLDRETLKRLPFSILTERLNQWCAQHDPSADLQSEHVKPMSWNDARQLHKLGFAIGAHGVTHAILTRETHDAALAEIARSISRVAEEIGSPCRGFAFPNGNFTAELAHHALTCGATYAVTTEPAWVCKGDPLWRLPRIQLFPCHSATKIISKIALAAIEGILPNEDGTGRSYFLSRRMARRSRQVY